MSVELKKKINDILFSKYVLEGSKDVELENIENIDKKQTSNLISFSLHGKVHVFRIHMLCHSCLHHYFYTVWTDQKLIFHV